jgi:hypothetical protein
MNPLRSIIRASPRAAWIAGKCLFLAGALLIVVAVFARVQLIGVNAGRAEAKLPPVTKLAQAYPQYPTWPVPEGPVGYTLAALLVMAGMVLSVRAGEILATRRR